MIRRTGFVWLAVICLRLAGCPSGMVRESSAGLTAGGSENVEPETGEKLTERYCVSVGKIDGGAIYVDLAGYAMGEDVGRMRELGLTEGDMSGGCYIKNSEGDIMIFQPREDMNYSSID